MGFFHLQRDDILRTSIYIGLFGAGGISVSNRIIQPQVRRYLIAISVLMGFWIAFRGIKYSLNTCAWLMRYFWYLYYLPMLSIPLLALFVAAALESCIQSGLIQANTGYEELFMAGWLGAQITDKENRVCIVSSNALELSEEQRKDAQTRPVSPNKNILIISHPIHFGHVLWQEDVTELSEAIEQIEENCRDLSERNSIRQKNLETRKNILALKEKNRVTDMLNRETSV